MKVGEKKPYVPVFVGSTFADLQLYRRAVLWSSENGHKIKLPGRFFRIHWG
jgi:hypothetical protein